jgi:hypothetical protein
MIIERGQAGQALKEAELRRRQVREAGPDEPRKALAWGVFVLVFVPLFDVIDDRIATR